MSAQEQGPRRRVSTTELRAVEAERDSALEALRQTKGRIQAMLSLRKSKRPTPDAQASPTEATVPMPRLAVVR